MAAVANNIGHEIRFFCFRSLKRSLSLGTGFTDAGYDALEVLILTGSHSYHKSL
jgi:hypothetical protein